MTTIGDVKEIFAEKGMHFDHLPPEDFLVTGMQVVERYVAPQGNCKVVLNMRGEEVISEGFKRSIILLSTGLRPQISS